MGGSYRLVALFARWSYDHWAELNDGSPRAAAMHQGPDEHDHILSAAFDHPPSLQEMSSALRFCQTELDNQDGKSELVEYAIMNEDTWRTFLEEDARWFREGGECRFPTVHHHGSLRSARERAGRSGATFKTTAA